MTPSSSVHASAVLAGDAGILIRGPSGSGKSRLAFDLILAGRAGQIPTTVLVGDDRIEVRGLGIRRCECVAQAEVRLVVDLAAQDSARMPEQEALTILIEGIKIPRIPVGTDYAALPLVAAALLTRPP
jgi:HPr kinase/phosphorylase